MTTITPPAAGFSTEFTPQHFRATKSGCYYFMRLLRYLRYKTRRLFVATSC
jgi:hypothetical protein